MGLVVKIFRASSLNALAQCSASLYLHRRDRRYLHKGEDVHAELEQWVLSESRDAAGLGPQAKRLVMLLSAQYQIPPPSGVAAELHMSLRSGCKRYGLSGKTDALVDDGDKAVVIDWKTGPGFHLPPIAEDYQMAAYAWLACHKIGIDRCRVYRVSEVRCEWVEWFETGAREAVDGLIVSRGLGDPLYETGGHCHRCLVRSSCERYMRDIGPVDRIVNSVLSGGLTDSDVIDAAESLPVLKEALSAIDSSLRSWVDVHGDIMLYGGVVYGKRKTTSRGRETWRYGLHRGGDCESD